MNIMSERIPKLKMGYFNQLSPLVTNKIPFLCTKKLLCLQFCREK